MRNRLSECLPPFLVLLAICGSLILQQPVGAQEESPDLPDEVKAWLEADQMRRWAGFLRDGETLFKEGSCVRCHGPSGEGTSRAPDLTDDVWVQSEGDLEGIQETIFWGVRRRDLADPSRPFQMNPSGGMDLERDQIQALAAYVWSLSNGTFLPERR